jgi:hypothetical protein
MAVVILAGATLFGCATTADNAKPKTAAAAAVNDPNCLTETGSRIASNAKCKGYGRSYSSTDIDRTGKTNAADAVALLDPSVTVHH